MRRVASPVVSPSVSRGTARAVRSSIGSWSCLASKRQLGWGGVSRGVRTFFFFLRGVF